MINTNEPALDVNTANSKKSIFKNHFLRNSISQIIIKKCLFLLIFLLPLFWSPLAVSSYNFGKYQVLFVLASISFLTWSIKIILKDKQISFNLNLLDISVLVFLLAGILSTIFSVDKYVSLFGSYGNFSDGLISLLSFGIVYFLIKGVQNQVNNKSRFTVEKLLKVFFISFSIVLFVVYFSVLGLWDKFSINNISVQQRIFNTVSFSLEGLSIFVSIVMVLLIGMILCSDFKIGKNFLKVLLFASLALLIIIDTIPAWIILLVGLSFLTISAFLIGSFKNNIYQLLLPIFFMIVSVLFIFINLGNRSPNSFLTFPQEQYLGQNVSYETAFNTIKERPKNIFIGSGPGTWINDFLKNRPAFFNEESILWNSRLNYAGNYISSLIATMGILGVLSYFSLIAFSLMGFYLSINKKSALPYISTIIAVLAGQFVYYQNTALMFLFWFIFGLGSVVWKDSLSRKFSIKGSFSSERMPECNLVFSVFLILLSFSVVAGFCFVAKECLADNYYIKAQQATNLSDAVSYLEKTVQQNPYRMIYRTVLSQIYLSQVHEEGNKPAEEQDVIILQERGSKVLEQINVFQNDFSGYVDAWEMTGVIYRDIQGSAELAVEAFEKAIEIDTKNPVLYLEIGKLYATLGDLEKTKESFTKALELKSNHVEALLLEALIYEEEDINKTITKLKEAEIKLPLNQDIKYQLGRLYYDQEETDLAISYFIETVQINPNYSNAYYSLGLAYEKKGDLKIAVAVFEKVLELSPGNQEIIQKIETLKAEIGE